MSDVSALPRRIRFFITLTLAAAGALYLVGIFVLELSFMRISDPKVLLFCAFLGAAGAGYVTAAMFGRCEKAGWVMSLIGAIVATLLGAALGGGLLSLFNIFGRCKADI